MTAVSLVRAFPSLLEAGRSAVAGALAALAASDEVPAIVAVDATCGNGNDSLFLARCLREATALSHKDYSVLSLDVQEAALASAEALLAGEECGGRVSLVLAGHEDLALQLAEHAGTLALAGRPRPVLAAVMYNLGFLPRSDRRVSTQKESTLLSLQAAREHLIGGGILAVHAYGGHAGGGDELAAVSSWCASLPYGDWEVAHYAIANKPRNPEALFLAQKR